MRQSQTTGGAWPVLPSLRRQTHSAGPELTRNRSLVCVDGGVVRAGTGSAIGRVHLLQRRTCGSSKVVAAHVTKIAVGAALSVGLGAAAFGVSAGMAAADPSDRHVWCPGQSMYSRAGQASTKKRGRERLPHLVLGQIWPQHPWRRAVTPERGGPSRLRYAVPWLNRDEHLTELLTCAAGTAPRPRIR